MKSQYSTMRSLPNTQIHNLHQLPNDEIDLMEILVILWKEKIWILATVMLFLIPVLFWTFTRPPVYAVDLLIDNAPSYSIDSLQPSTLVGGDQYQVEKLNKDFLFQKVINQLETLHIQRLFWESRSQNTLSTNPQLANTENDIAFEKFAKNLKLIKPDPKKTNSTVNKITLTTSDPANGIALLNAYSHFLNNYIVDTAISQMEEGYQSNLSQLKADYTRLTAREKEKLSDRLIQLTEQLEVARSLNIIETPYDKLSGIELQIVDNRLYMLGTKALEEEIKTLKMRQEKQPSVFASDLRNMEHWQKTMEDDLQKLQSLKTRINVFEVISPPISSLDSVSPKKLLIILGVLLLSLISGAIFVLIRHGIRNYKLRPVRLHT